LSLTPATEQGDSILARPGDLHPRGRRIDAVRNLLPAGDVQAHPAVEKPHDFIGLEIDDGVLIEVQGASIGVEDLDTPGLRSNAVSGENRHRCRRSVHSTVAFEHGRSIDEGNVRRRRLRRGILSKDRKSRMQQGRADDQEHSQPDAISGRQQIRGSEALREVACHGGNLSICRIRGLDDSLNPGAIVSGGHGHGSPVAAEAGLAIAIIAPG
jgi:hypothetical protein